TRDQLDRALERCEKALAVTPDRSAPYNLMADAAGFMAVYLFDRGEDPRPISVRRIAASEQAIRVGGERFASYEEIGTAHSMIANYEITHGLDPRRSAEGAIAASRRAVELDPKNPWGYVALGLAEEILARARAGAGEDAAPDFLAAVGAFAKSAELDRDYLVAYADPLFTPALFTQWLSSRGEGFASRVEQREALFDACVRVNPRHVLCYENAGVLDFRIAEARFLAGEDPAGALGLARERLEKASTLDKDYLE